MVSNRRDSDRLVRRVPVRFWLAGEAHAVNGYTTNISTTGMFVVTGHPAPRGSRIRIEVLDPRCGFVVEAEVARAHRVATELAALGMSGMGVRFLPVAALVRELFPEAIRAERTGGGAEVPAEGASDPRSPTPSSRSEPGPGASRAVPGAAPGAAAPGASRTGERRSPFAVRFSSIEQFDAVYERDLRQGGLFVATSEPARIGELVEIDLHLPAPLTGLVRLRARVVHRIEPAAAEGLAGPNLLAGMGVELVDPRGALAALAPFLRQRPQRGAADG